MQSAVVLIYIKSKTLQRHIIIEVLNPHKHDTHMCRQTRWTDGAGDRRALTVESTIVLLLMVKLLNTVKLAVAKSLAELVTSALIAPSEIADGEYGHRST